MLSWPCWIGFGKVVVDPEGDSLIAYVVVADFAGPPSREPFWWEMCIATGTGTGTLIPGKGKESQA